MRYWYCCACPALIIEMPSSRRKPHVLSMRQLDLSCGMQISVGRVICRCSHSITRDVILAFVTRAKCEIRNFLNAATTVLSVHPPRSRPRSCCFVNRVSAIMASGLIGISVSVTLQNPPNTVVQGLVANVNPQTSTLTLQNGRRNNPFDVFYLPVSAHAYHELGIGDWRY
jgi:hypothetical protein